MFQIEENEPPGSILPMTAIYGFVFGQLGDIAAKSECKII